VQRKLCATLAAKSLVTFKFEDFLTALNLINRVINVGDIFTGTQSPTLRTAIKQHAVTYFKAAHRQRMEVRPATVGRGRRTHAKELAGSRSADIAWAPPARLQNLKTMLENESWYICPVRPDFGIDSAWSRARTTGAPSHLPDARLPASCRSGREYRYARV